LDEHCILAFRASTNLPSLCLDFQLMDISASLPDELLLAVLHAGIDNLDWECRDVCSLGLVSRRLNELTNSNDLWAKLWKKEWPADVKKEDPGCWKRVFRFRCGDLSAFAFLLCIFSTHPDSNFHIDFCCSAYFSTSLLCAVQVYALCKATT
jgi:hypothetical protein